MTPSTEKFSHYMRGRDGLLHEVPDSMPCMTYDLSVKVRPWEFGSSPMWLELGGRASVDGGGRGKYSSLRPLLWIVGFINDRKFYI